MAEEEPELQLWQTVEPVEFNPKLDDNSQKQALLIAARQGIGYAIIGGVISHALQTRATHVLLDCSANACAIRYQIDGNWEQLPPVDRESSDALVYALKQVSLLNPADRRTAQTGSVDIKLKKEKFNMLVQSQGVPTGERILLKFEPEKIPFEKMTDLGMRDKMFEAYKSHLNSEGTVVLVTAPKSEGLTTTWTTSINCADRLIRDFQSFEAEDSPEPEVININPNYYGGSTETTLSDLLYKAILKEPDVLLFPELPDADAFGSALGHVAKAQKQIITRVVASSAMEGAVRLLATYRDHASDIIERLCCVIGQRLVRRLCDNCKVGFPPPPQLLQQLGIPQGRVGMLYQPFFPPPIEQQVDEEGNPAPIIPCHICNGRGYFGRIAIFEMLLPGPQLKAALLKTQDLNQLNAVAKSEGHRGIQAEAVVAVARGLTGLDELRRAFSGK